MTAVRRSHREKKQAENFYNDAKEELESHRLSMESASASAASVATSNAPSAATPSSTGSTADSSTGPSKRGRKASSKAASKSNQKKDAESETEEETPAANAADIFDSSDEGEENDSDDDAFQPRPKKKSKQKPAASRATTKVANNKNKVQVLLKPFSSASNNSSKKGGAKRVKGKKMDSARRAINLALANLSRRVLDPAETTDPYSLVAGLLYSYKATSSNSKNPFVTAASATDSSYASHPRTVYTPQLESLASTIIQQHNSDPNRAQIHLLNLLFRSVGGTVDTNLDPDEEDEDGLPEINLEDMDNDTWARIVTDLVDEMRHTPADHILLCADPNGAVHAAAAMENADNTEGSGVKPKDTAVTAASLGVREYRNIYEEFWYVLGCVALTEGAMSNNAKEEHEEIDDSSDEEDEEGLKRKKSKTGSKTKKKKSKDPTYTTTIRYDVELVRDLMTRVSELVSVGQPDVRAAATIAAMSMGHAVLDKTNVLAAKLDIATRQLAAAVKASASSGKSPGKKEW
mmetsp:Transcript_24504/g.36304  ORF Transcript_24504/g.36304 Transcript_24504/m.36304 type:complete len:519 (+) Transcript_24504:217-1773(+)